MFDMDQQKVTFNCKIAYPISWRQAVKISTDRPETKMEFADVALPVRKNVGSVRFNR